MVWVNGINKIIEFKGQKDFLSKGEDSGKVLWCHLSWKDWFYQQLENGDF